MSWRGLAKRVMSPSSAITVAAATSAIPRSACNARTTGAATNPAAPLDMSFQTVASRRRADRGNAVFQHGVMRRCSNPAGTSDGASMSTPADCNDGHDAGESQRAALGRCTYCRRSWFHAYSSSRLLSNSRKISLKFECVGCTKFCPLTWTKNENTRRRIVTVRGCAKKRGVSPAPPAKELSAKSGSLTCCDVNARISERIGSRKFKNCEHAQEMKSGA